MEGVFTLETGKPQPSGLLSFLFRELDYQQPPTPPNSFPGGSVVKNLPAMQEIQEVWVQFLGREDLLEEKMASTPVLLLGNPVDRGACGLQSIGSQGVGHD